jgi:hypothetical protein
VARQGRRSARVPKILSAIEDEIPRTKDIETVLEVLEEPKPAIFGRLRKQFSSPVLAQAVTLKNPGPHSRQDRHCFRWAPVMPKKFFTAFAASVRECVQPSAAIQ